MSTDPNAPMSPPMMSPDRKWVWDGKQWLPVAAPMAPAPAPAQESVFPAYNAATQSVPMTPVMASPPVMAPPPVQVQVPYPVAPSPVAVPPPLWAPPKTGINNYLYIGAGAVVVLIVLVVIAQLAGVISLPFGSRPAQVATQPKSTVPQLSARSDYARAERVMKGVVTPALAGLNDTLGPLDQGCHGTLTIACSSTLGPADREIKHAISLIDGAQTLVPPCVAPGVAAIRRDLAGMDTNIGLMQTAFDQNDSGSVKGYYLRYENGHAALSTDLQAATQAQQNGCVQDISGP